MMASIKAKLNSLQIDSQRKIATFDWIVIQKIYREIFEQEAFLKKGWFILAQFYCCIRRKKEEKKGQTRRHFFEIVMHEIFQVDD